MAISSTSVAGLKLSPYGLGGGPDGEGGGDGLAAWSCLTASPRISGISIGFLPFRFSHSWHLRAATSRSCGVVDTSLDMLNSCLKRCSGVWRLAMTRALVGQHQERDAIEHRLDRLRRPIVGARIEVAVDAQGD